MEILDTLTSSPLFGIVLCIFTFELGYGSIKS